MPSHTPERVPKGERTRASILAAAEALFAQRGFEGTTFAAIADQVGVQQPAIYYYFPDKESLYEEVVSSAIESVEARTLDALASARSPRTRLLEAVEVWVDAVAARPTLAMLLLREAAKPEPGDVHARLTKVGARIFGAILEALASDAGAGVARVDALHFSSCMTGSTLFFVAANSRMVGENLLLPLQADALERHKELLRATAALLIRRHRTQVDGNASSARGR